jgi:hypothetical protein
MFTGPREVPSTVPPCLWISSTIVWAQRARAPVDLALGSPFGSQGPSGTPYPSCNSRKSERTTLLRPGHRPPHVTMPARDRFGSKNSHSRGPASSKRSPSSVSFPGCRRMISGMRSSSLISALRVERMPQFPSVVTFIMLLNVASSTVSPARPGHSIPESSGPKRTFPFAQR